jgi:prenyltransferase beta subunit
MDAPNIKLTKLLAIIFGLGLILSPLEATSAYDSTAALTYLQNHANSPWSTMALSLLNASSIPSDYLKTINSNNAIDLEAPILAIAALNQDPRNFGSTDYVAKLESFHSSGQIGDQTALNDDIFGILALVAAGQPLTDATITDAKNFLLQHQNSDGGWGFATGSGSDSNTTAAAIVALAAVNLSSSDTHIQNALTYLKTAQNSDGGFTYDPKSSYGTASDSSSTAWVLWALDALNIDQSTFSQGSLTPKNFLESNQTPSGYFKFQNDSSEDSFSAITTAYAVIALLGKTLPVHIYSAGSSQSQTFVFRIEGSQSTICSGQTAGPTALDIVKNASLQCGFTYHIQSTSFGPYLDQINSDAAAGQIGWLYLVNDVAPDIGAGDYQLKPSDQVLWYFGDFSWQPLRLSLAQTQIDSGQSAQATTEAFQNGSWAPLAGATITAGLSSFTTDASGHANIAGADGYYKVAAAKTDYVRSNEVLLQIGQPNSSAVSLSATISGGQTQGTSTPISTIAFSVNPSSLDFGDLSPGTNSSKQITLNNAGTTGLHIESSVSGNNLFSDNLKINNLSWQAFATDLDGGQNQNANLTLAVPQTYSNSGQKSGQLIFWVSAK